MAEPGTILGLGSVALVLRPYLAGFLVGCWQRRGVLIATWKHWSDPVVCEAENIFLNGEWSRLEQEARQHGVMLVPTLFGPLPLPSPEKR